MEYFSQIPARPLLDCGQYIQRYTSLSGQQYFIQWWPPGIEIEQIINREERLPLHIEELRNRIFEVKFAEWLLLAGWQLILLILDRVFPGILTPPSSQPSSEVFMMLWRRNRDNTPLTQRLQLKTSVQWWITFTSVGLADPSVQDGVVLHDHHDRPDSPPSGQTPRHGQTSQDSEDSHHFKTAREFATITY